MDDVRRSPLRLALVATLWVLAAVVVLPAGALAYMLFHTDRWEAEVPAVVTGIEDFYYAVDLTAPLPPGALTTVPTGGGLVFEDPGGYLRRGDLRPGDLRPGDLRPGDSVVCRVVQTYTMNTDFDSGPRTKIEGCRR